MTARDLANILAIYQGSNGDATKALYADLQPHGIIGEVATNLFRACKASERATVYRGGGYRGQAYEKKDWSLGLLCDALVKGAQSLDIRWGWGLDPRAVGFENVLYIDLPTGQVSFHNARRIKGPDYPGAWDGVKGQAATRICQYVASVFAANSAGTAPEPAGIGARSMSCRDNRHGDCVPYEGGRRGCECHCHRP